jgi:hypothetical protein
MRVMASGCPVCDVRRADGNSTGLFFGGPVDLVVLQKKPSKHLTRCQKNRKTHVTGTSFEILNVFARFHLDVLVITSIKTFVVVATGLQVHVVQLASAVLEHVGGANLTRLEVVLDIAGSICRVDRESEDAGGVGKSGGENNKVSGELHD